MEQGELFAKISVNLQPDRPIRSSELLRGRDEELDTLERELRHFHSIPFVFGHRGVGKTSLARTAAQMVTPSDREHIYVACAPNSGMLEIFREVGEALLGLCIQLGAKQEKKQKVETQLSLNPYIRTSIENEIPKLEPFSDVNEAVRTLRQLDEILPRASETVAIIDELEELNQNDRDALAFLVKQIGDQNFQTRFVLVGIAENVHELIGAHASVPRYIKEISLEPLIAQNLIDVVSSAANELSIKIAKEILFKVAIIGNGFPHFAHLIGKELLIEAVISESNLVTRKIYKKGIERAINSSLQELRVSYEAATQRGDDYFRHMIWALADFGVVDVRIDEWEERYHQLCKKYRWVQTTHKKFASAVGNFNKQGYGGIIRNTPAKYGSAEIRYRYKRFANSLMKGHVRLQAEAADITLGDDGPTV